MRARYAICAIAMLGLGGPTPSVAQSSSPAAPALTAMPPDAEKHIDAGRALIAQGAPKSAVGEFFNTSRNANFVTPSLLPQPDHPLGTHDLLPPTKVFDQLYYIGNVFVGCWVLVTSGGIIMWDAMDNVDEAEHIVEAGYKTLGLDPSTIKYIIITHGHGDHYGGVPFFAKKYPGIHVLSSPADWELMEQMTSRFYPASTAVFRFGPPPRRDVAISDGQKLTLGDTTVTLYITPGHTKGPVSAIVPVSDHAVRHTVAIFGGFGLPPHLKPTNFDDGLDIYERQVKRFIAICRAAGVDAVVSTHPGFDGTEYNVEKIKARKQGDPNPWVMGTAGVARFWKLDQEMSAALHSLIVAAGKQ